jgi:hypothetical protein
VVLVALLATGCGGTFTDAGPDAEPDADPACPGGCRDDEVCREGACVPRGSLCTDVVCPAGQQCVLGQCIPDDPCAEMVCPNAGDVCQHGVCISGGADNDGDGVTASEDCDDSNVTVFPGAAELCNGVDDDCDSAIDEAFDEDGDGFSGCEATPAMLFDCDDSSAWVNPAAEERCNGRDDTCDTEIDEGFDCVQGREIDCETTCASTGRGVCDATCHAPGPAACEPPAEVCNGVDDDCDGATDDGFERPQCPLTGELGADQAACDAGCAVVHACTSSVNLPTAAGSASYTGQCTTRVEASGNAITFYQQSVDWEGTCSWSEVVIGTIALGDATASGSVSYTGQCTMRVEASGSTITFYQQSVDWEGTCSWSEVVIGTITLSGVTTYACPAGGAFPCTGGSPSCTQTASCVPVVVCE